jgi:hypothetical protein
MKTFFNKISLLLLTVAISTSFLFADNLKDNSNEEEIEYIYATTESGEKVILYSDGTWEFDSDETAETKVSEEVVKRTVNPKKFSTPASSKEVLKGSNVDYQVHYNKEKWERLEKNLNENAEYSLIHSDKNSYAIIIPEKISIPVENLKNIVISNARNASKNVKVLVEEERTVNNTKVIMLNIQADIQGMTFVYLYYIYSNEKASIQLIGFTTDELYEEYKKDMEDLLNGFEVIQTDKK